MRSREDAHDYFLVYQNGRSHLRWIKPHCSPVCSFFIHCSASKADIIHNEILRWTNLHSACRFFKFIQCCGDDFSRLSIFICGENLAIRLFSNSGNIKDNTSKISSNEKLLCVEICYSLRLLFFTELQHYRWENYVFNQLSVPVRLCLRIRKSWQRHPVLVIRKWA